MSHSRRSDVAEILFDLDARLVERLSCVGIRCAQLGVGDFSHDRHPRGLGQLRAKAHPLPIGS